MARLVDDLLDVSGISRGKIDLRKVGHYYYATQPVADLLRNDTTRELGLKLFKKAWEAFPQYRGYILAQRRVRNREGDRLLDYRMSQ